MTAPRAFLRSALVPRVGVAYMLVGTAGFALMQIFVKLLKDLPLQQTLLFRALFTMSVTYWWLRREKVSPWGNNKRLLLLRSAVGAVSFFLFFYTLQAMPLATAVTVQHLSPVFATVLALFFLREPVRPVQWGFMAVAFSGVMLVQGVDWRVEAFPLAAGLGAALFSGMVYVLIRSLRGSEHPGVVVFFFPMVSVPFAVAFCLWEWQAPTPVQWLYLFLSGLFSQVGQMGFTWALQSEKANTVASLNYLGVLYALFFGYLVFGETHGPWALGGMALVLAGVALNVFRS
jgi:drug/metabolite transporter (DMT)-like permease